MLSLIDHKLTLIAVLVLTISMSGVYFEDAFAVFSTTQPNAYASYNSATNEVQVEWDFTTGDANAPETCLLKGDFWFMTDLNNAYNTSQSDSDNSGHQYYDHVTQITGFIPIHYSVVSSTPETTSAGTTEVIPCTGTARIALDTVMSHESNRFQDGVTQREDLQIFLSFYAVDGNTGITLQTFGFQSATFMDQIFVAYTPTVTTNQGFRDYACQGEIGNVLYIEQSSIHGNNGDNCNEYLVLNSNQYVDIGGANNAASLTNGETLFGDHTPTSYSLLALVGSSSIGNVGTDCFGDCQAPTMGVAPNGNRVVEGGFTYNGQSVNVLPAHTPFPLITAQVGHDNHVIAKVYESQGLDSLRRVQFSMGLEAVSTAVDLADVIIDIWFEYGGSDVTDIKITDKHNLIDKDSILVETAMVNCRNDNETQCASITLHHTYREAPIFNTMKVMVMDIYHYSIINSFNDGVEVIGESMNPADITYTHVPSILYPQKSGLIELTNIDRGEQLWIDPYGYVWQGDDSKMILISDIPPKSADDDAKSKFSGYNNRINSHFTEYMQEQEDKATILFDSSLIQNEAQ